MIKELREKINLKDQNLFDEIEKVYKEEFIKYENKSEEKLPLFEKLKNDDKGLTWVIIEISKNIKRLNGSSNDELDYDEFLEKWNYGLQTIVIGGEKLSR